MDCFSSALTTSQSQDEADIVFSLFGSAGPTSASLYLGEAYVNLQEQLRKGEDVVPSTQLPLLGTSMDGRGVGIGSLAVGVHGVGHLQALLDRACARSPRSRSPRSTPSVSVSSRQESPMPPALHLARPLAPLHGPRTGAGAIATPALSSSVAQDTSGSIPPHYPQSAGTFTLPLPGRVRTS